MKPSGWRLMGGIQKGVEFIPVREDNLVAFRLNEQDGTEEWNEIIVIYNSNRFPVSIDIKGIDSSWQVVIDVTGLAWGL